MKKRLILLLWGVLLTASAFSQVLFDGKINENLLKGRVKQIEEFMARFNNEEDWESKKATQTDSIYRTQFLRTLFDHSRYPITNKKMPHLAEKFIQDIIKEQYKIHFTDTTWSAQVDCKVVIGGKVTKMKLCLQTEQKAPYEYVWVISDYDTPLLRTDSTAPRPIISPTEHEVGFMGLLSLSTQGKKNVSYLFPKKMQTDRLPILAFLIKNGLIRFIEISDVSFRFFVPGYAFIIKRIERKNSYNTGWLITQLNKL